ncbi:MAG: GtrA family protein, partial [Chloroflexota bacterium]
PLVSNITNFYQSHPKEVTRFIKFSVVGAIGAVIDFGLLNLLLYLFDNVLGWHILANYSIDGNLLVANTLSVGAAILSNFTWNRLWTYPESRSRKKRTQLPQFMLVNLIGLLINTVIVVGLDFALIEYLDDPWRPNLAKLIAIGVVLIWNFGANRLWTYRGL